MKLLYRSVKKYKYQVHRMDYLHEIPELKNYSHKCDFIQLVMGVLTIRIGYAWDGPSGLTWDTESSIRGSAVHDALYQLMRLEALPLTRRWFIDNLLRDICIEDGMYKWRASMWRYFVGKFGEKHARPPK